MSLIDREKTMEEIPIDVCDGFEVTDIIEKMPPVQAIPIPDNATNYDVLKAVFGNITAFRIKDTMEFEKGFEFWFSKPYKRGVEK